VHHQHTQAMPCCCCCCCCMHAAAAAACMPLLSCCMHAACMLLLLHACCCCCMHAAAAACMLLLLHACCCCSAKNPQRCQCHAHTGRTHLLLQFLGRAVHHGFASGRGMQAWHKQQPAAGTGLQTSSHDPAKQTLRCRLCSLGTHTGTGLCSGDTHPALSQGSQQRNAALPSPDNNRNMRPECLWKR